MDPPWVMSVTIPAGPSSCWKPWWSCFCCYHSHGSQLRVPEETESPNQARRQEDFYPDRQTCVQTWTDWYGQNAMSCERESGPQATKCGVLCSPLSRTCSGGVVGLRLPFRLWGVWENLSPMSACHMPLWTGLVCFFWCMRKDLEATHDFFSQSHDSL